MINLFKKKEVRSSTLDTFLNAITPTGSGSNVTSTTAVGLPAVFCAVNTISEAVASMPLHVFNTNTQGQKERQRGSILERILNISPNGYQTAYDFKVALMRSVLLTGNGYARIIYSSQGQIERLVLLHPNSVTTALLPTGRIGFKVSQEGQFLNLQQEEVLHVKINSDDGITGKSPITACRESIGAEIASQEHGSKFFQNGASPYGGFKTDQHLDQESYDRMKDLLSNHQGSANAYKPLILEGGLDWVNIAVSNQDAEWIESRKFGISEIARMFKISPIFLMDYSNSTYSNFSEASKAFLGQTLRPWLTNIESALLLRLIADDSQQTTSIEFETKDMLRTTPEERYKIYDIAIRNGLMSPNECRKAENLPARTQGDEYSQSWNQQAL